MRVRGIPCLFSVAFFCFAFVHFSFPPSALTFLHHNHARYVPFEAESGRGDSVPTILRYFCACLGGRTCYVKILPGSTYYALSSSATLIAADRGDLCNRIEPPIIIVGIVSSMLFRCWKGSKKSFDTMPRSAFKKKNWQQQQPVDSSNAALLSANC